MALTSVNHADALREKLQAKTATIGVIGLGYVGLPLIRAFEHGGILARWASTSISAKSSGCWPARATSSISPRSGSASWLDDKRFEPTADMRRLGEADALLICVPTPLTDSRDPDLSYVEAHDRADCRSPCGRANWSCWRAPPIRAPRAMSCCRSWPSRGLKVGQDFFLAYSPEREDPGNPDFSASRIPKVVGGSTQRVAAVGRVCCIAAPWCNTVPVSSCEVAEACKILENTYRSVNIAMVNELKMLFDRMGIDVWEVIDAAKTKPFGFQAFYPGPGLGGHCIPIDPFYLSWVARKHEHAHPSSSSWRARSTPACPRYVVDRVIGSAERRGQADPRQQRRHPGRGLQERRRRPAREPVVRADGVAAAAAGPCSATTIRTSRCCPACGITTCRRLASEELTPEYLASLDCVLIATDHSGLRLRSDRAPRAAGGRHPQRHEERAPRPRQDRQGLASALRTRTRIPVPRTLHPT